ncbi:type II toxin-antitoxin system RelE/ParE family toxin [Acidithiobacillus sulfurivorans]|uniref:Type II toxin-antitoxin system RelE/ParE family toxin n=1 Tax=Acidithiobacillus sulfurivorans TaxID=1958756 RepID=A0ABS5ZYX8_9PROT|nr:type II toxin-antitoxin system RelE/ParE family toxin [Acidithiobacillus sulfurivorans]MBU2760409.1 type II toxin-antitoxin system RelE/ParE family toxin [Acidithiobacillus sulfurivorans]
MASPFLIDIRLLAETPSLGKSKPDIGEDVLSFPYASHIIYYLVHERQLVVFGVLHKRMVPMNHLDGRELPEFNPH